MGAFGVEIVHGGHVDGLRLDAIGRRKGQLDGNSGAGPQIELGVGSDGDGHVAGGQRVQEDLVGIATWRAFGDIGADAALADRHAGRLKLAIAQIDVGQILAVSQRDGLRAGGVPQHG